MRECKSLDTLHAQSGSGRDKSTLVTSMYTASGLPELDLDRSRSTLQGGFGPDWNGSQLICVKK